MGSKVVVTGANSGIGRAVAENLMSQGHEVLGVDTKSGEGLSRLERNGAQVLRGDLTNETFREEIVANAAGLEQLVNCAGVMRLKSLGELTEADWDLVFDVNAKASFFLTNALSRVMADGGAIVNVSSMSARRANNSETTIYAASKAAILSLTRSQAHAFAPRGIRVNAVLPGFIDTPMQHQVIRDTAAARGDDAEDLAGKRLNDVPLGRLGSPEETAELIVWLLSPVNTYMTGQSVAIDGGMTMY